MGCRRVRDPAELVRVSRPPDGGLRVGPGPGRGAWLCGGSVACLDTAVSRGALERALRGPLRTDEGEQLRARMNT